MVYAATLPSSATAYEPAPRTASRESTARLDAFEGVSYQTSAVWGAAAVSVAARCIGATVTYRRYAAWLQPMPFALAALPAKWCLDKVATRGGFTGHAALAASGVLYGAMMVLWAPGVFVATPAVVAGAVMVSAVACVGAVAWGLSMPVGGFERMARFHDGLHWPLGAVAVTGLIAAMVTPMSAFGVVGVGCFVAINGAANVVSIARAANLHLNGPNSLQAGPDAVRLGQILARDACEGVAFGIWAGAVNWRAFTKHLPACA